ncbi:MAG: hypothetical protein OEM02_13325, partial [Desulfobulbaceae bacterium]|nr:hypothetical protein [Desulfobulbaceae bacterium]
ILQATAVGPIYPNLAVFGWSNKYERRHAYINELRIAYTIGMSLVMVKHNGIPAPEHAKRIDIWWRGRKNGNLMLLLGFLLTENWEWSGTIIRLLRVVNNEAGTLPARDSLVELVNEARVEATVEVITSAEPFSEVLKRHSKDASCVMLGFELPSKEKETAWHTTYLSYLSQLPTTVLLVNSSGEEDLLA